MATSAPARTTSGRTPAILLAGVLVVIAAMTALGGQLLASSSSPSTSATPVGPRDSATERVLVLPREQRGALGEADGAVPGGTTVFDDAVPGVANLDPPLLSAVRQAASAAAPDGVTFFVDSGWRSPEYQQQLLDEAVSKYGSVEEAARWVATPNRSAHVKGEAVDIGRSNAAAWLSEHGAQYGLCRVYANEPWHFELRSGAAAQGCPATYADPTQDPRMQQR